MKTTRTCTKCNRRRWIGNFRALEERSLGDIRYHPWCKECERLNAAKGRKKK